MATRNPLAIKDEEFLESAPPEVIKNDAEIQQQSDEHAGTWDGSSEESTETTDSNESESEGESNAEEGAARGAGGEEEANEGEDGNFEEDASPQSKSIDPSQKQDKTADSKSKVTEEAPDYAELYKTIMQPFKANGRMIELQSPDEAIKLMQMGANYTKKLQEMQPAKKLLTMLENAQISEDDLSYLIDIKNKNPEAIRKLLVDGNIDPLDIDTSSPSEYVASNHKVSDQEINFRAVMEEVTSTPDGERTVGVVNSTWDQASKQVLWNDPELLKVIDYQRQTGIYDRIVNEVERRKTVGLLAPSVTFLESYKHVGDLIEKQNGFADLVSASAKKSSPNTQPAGDRQVSHKGNGSPKVLASRVLVSRPSSSNLSKAADSAASPRSSSRVGGKVINPLALSDDEFLKLMSNRV